MSSLKILVWNARGLNSSAKRSVVSQVVGASGANLVCIQETKLQCISLDVVRQCLGNEFLSFYFLSSVGTRGGILLA